MFTNKFWRPVLLVIFLSGCASIKSQLGFKEIQDLTKERTGREIYWNQGTQADKQAEDKIQNLLSKELTAAEAVQIALLNNRNLQASYEQLNIAQADLVESGLLSNPVFDTELRFHKGGGLSIEAAVVQNFIDLVFLSLRKKVATAAFEASKLRVLKEVVDLASNVERQFYNYYTSGEKLRLAKDILTASEASYLISKRLREAGNIREIDLANERTFFEEAKIELRKAKANVIKSRETLNGMMGISGNDVNWVLQTTLPIPILEPSKEADLEVLALKRSLDLGIIKWEINEAASSLGIAEPFGVLTEVEGGASAEREAESGEWGVGPAFSFPIPIFNQGQPDILRASSILKSKKESYEGASINLRAQVRSEIESLNALKDEVNYYKNDLIPLKKKIVKESQLQYNAMQIGASNLIQARKDEIEAANKYLTAQRNFWSANANINQLLSGSMSTPEIESDVSFNSNSKGEGH